MNIQNMLLKLIVFSLPAISGVYIFAGVKLSKHKEEDQLNYFSLVMFAAALYTAGYFLALNAQNTETFLLCRSIEYLGAVFVPSFAILFVSAYTGNNLPLAVKRLLIAVSGLLWLLYLSNPLHHWTYRRIEMITVQGFSIASTTKNFGYYLIFAYYIVFLVVSLVMLRRGSQQAESSRLRKSCQLLLVTIHVAWIAVLIIILGFDTYFDPAPIVIFLIAVLIGICEIRSDFFELEINRWNNAFQDIGEVAFLINGEREIIAKNNHAQAFWHGRADALAVREVLDGLDQADRKQTPVMMTVNGEERCFHVNANSFNEKRKFSNYTLKDITEHNQAEQALQESEEKNRLLITQMAQGLAVHEVLLDEAGNVFDYRFLDVNKSYERLTGLKKEDIIGKTVLEVLPDTEAYWIETYGEVALTGKPVRFEEYSRELGKHYEVVAYSPRLKEFAVIISDISNRKKAEAEISYLSYHDALTGLYNRRFYEEEMNRLDTVANLPITLIMADVNGLKLINDSFGHAMGDELLKKAAQLITAACPKESIIARLGGDEFISVLPGKDRVQAAAVIRELKMKTAVETIGGFDVSISFGAATKESRDQDVQEIYRRAEDAMYRHKLYETTSVKSKTIDLIMNTLYEKSNREMQHSRRVSELCKRIATAMNLDKDTISQIGLAGLMHDIGKMGIEENILNSNQTLDADDWSEIRRHPEMGYRILSSSNEFSKIARYVFEHHEWWDGGGYPQKLCGEEISIEARIIALADAYDAMTCDRPYRKGLSRAEAIVEVRRWAGKQFDPEIAEIFLEKVLKAGKIS